MDPNLIPPDAVATGIGAGAVTILGLTAWALKTSAAIAKDLVKCATDIARDLATISEELRNLQERVGGLARDYDTHARETRSLLDDKTPHKPLS